MMTVDKIIAGGQTGVDRAALDAALEFNIPLGGWCPAGRRAEDGCINHKYTLVETPSQDYLQRTEWNVRDSDATLILTNGEPEGGTAATINYAHEYRKPVLVIDLNKWTDDASAESVRSWLLEHKIRVLNVAGPRHSKQPTIYKQALKFLGHILSP